MPVNEAGGGGIVICDNAAAHKVAGVREAPARVGVGADLPCLPPCRPDLNPVE